MKSLLTIVFIFCISQLHAQKWIDTLYKFTKTTVTYGSAADFAGNNRSLTMDICVPNNDLPPSCGRPILIAIHGGAFMAGSKEDYDIQKWMKDYAKRGYVTAAINYRLGMFQTTGNVHCNATQLFNTPWDCSNMADTAEWYRGCYRGIQDAKGAIRYFILNKSQYNIDPRNIFLAGESAGGFIALGAAFVDTIADKAIQCEAISAVKPPNAIYENTCVQQFGWDTSIASMKLSRPDLGSIEGALNNTAGKYLIKGVGNFFGGMFPGWLNNSASGQFPAIYLYHQPNDIIVPYKTNKVLKGYSDCFTNLGCASLISNPWLHGSAGVRNQIENLKKQGKKSPNYWFDSTLNNADCAAQALDPSLTGHAIDNYWLRSLHMAQYFAPLIDTSSNCSLFIKDRQVFNSGISVYPNPFNSEINIETNGQVIQSIQLTDITGRKIPFICININGKIHLQFESLLKPGFYLIEIRGANGMETIKQLIKQ